MIWRSPTHKPSARSRRTRGVLLILSTFLVASALLRFGEGVGRAFARAPEATEESSTPSTQTCETPEDMKALLDALQERGRMLEERETALRNREQVLKLVEQEAGQKIAALTTAEEDLRRMIALTESAAENDVAQLTKVYESMKPKQAAALFEEMDPVFAAGFLARMRPDAAADVLAGLSPGVAHGISVILAGRNATAPRQ